MDPFVTTILKQGALIAAGVAIVVFGAYCLIAMANLRHALTLNMLPSQLPA